MKKGKEEYEMSDVRQLKRAKAHDRDLGGWTLDPKLLKEFREHAAVSDLPPSSEEEVEAILLAAARLGYCKMDA